MASQASCSTGEKTPKEVPLFYFEGSPPSTFGVQSPAKANQCDCPYIHVYDDCCRDRYGNPVITPEAVHERDGGEEKQHAELMTLLTNRIISHRVITPRGVYKQQSRVIKNSVLVLSEEEFCSDAFIGNHCVGRGFGALCGFFVGTRVSVINIDEGRVAELDMKPYYAILLVPSQTDLEAMKQYVGVEANRAKLSDSQHARVNNALFRIAYEGRERGAPEYVSCVYNTLETMLTNNIYTPSRQRRYWKGNTKRRSVYAWSMFMLLRDTARMRALLPHLRMLGLSADSLLAMVKGAEKMKVLRR